MNYVLLAVDDLLKDMTGDIDTATHSLPPLAAAVAGDTVPATGQPLPSHTMTTLPHGRHCDPLYCQSVVESTQIVN